jgi:hypothetical protein
MRGELNHWTVPLSSVTGITKTSTMIVARQTDDEKFTRELAVTCLSSLLEGFGKKGYDTIGKTCC